MSVSGFIRVQPARHKRAVFARWAVSQAPKVRTVSQSAFGVPLHLFPGVPERLLRGALVNGHPYVPVPVDEPAAAAAEPRAAEPAPAATAASPRETEPDVPALSVPVPEAPAPTGGTAEPRDDAPAIEGEQVTAVEDAAGPGCDTTGDSDAGAPDSDKHECPDPQCLRAFDTPRGLDIHVRRAHRED